MKASLLIFISTLLSLVSFAQVFTNIESVEYDPTQNRFLVSNGNSIIQRASNGTLDYFGSGSSNFGMEVMNGTLFAIKDLTIKGYDLGTEEEVMSVTITGASFLNGLTNDGNNRLWATDFSGKSIYEINVADFANPSFLKVVSNIGSTPNGIIYDGDNNRLIFVSWGGSASVMAVNLTDYSVSTIINTPYGNIDGIDEDDEGNYYISYWSPAGVSKYPSDFSSPSTISVPGIATPADICYAKEIDTLAIPSGGDEVLFVGFGVPNALDEFSSEDFQFSISPNPMKTETVIQFFLKKSQSIKLGIYNIEGKLIRSLAEGLTVEGYHKVLLTGVELSAGTYIVKLATAQGLVSKIMLVH